VLFCPVSIRTGCNPVVNKFASQIPMLQLRVSSNSHQLICIGRRISNLKKREEPSNAHPIPHCVINVHNPSPSPTSPTTHSSGIEHCTMPSNRSCLRPRVHDDSFGVVGGTSLHSADTKSAPRTYPSASLCTQCNRHTCP